MTEGPHTLLPFVLFGSCPDALQAAELCVHMQAGVHVWVVSPAWVDQCVAEQQRAMVSRPGSSCAWEDTHLHLHMLSLRALRSACHGSTQVADVGAVAEKCWRQEQLLAVRAHLTLGTLSEGVGL